MSPQQKQIPWAHMASISVYVRRKWPRALCTVGHEPFTLQTIASQTKPKGTTQFFSTILWAYESLEHPKQQSVSSTEPRGAAAKPQGAARFDHARKSS